MVAKSGSSGCYSVDYYRIAKCQDHDRRGGRREDATLSFTGSCITIKKKKKRVKCAHAPPIYVSTCSAQMSSFFSCLPHSHLSGHHRQARSIRHDPWDRVIGACFTSRAFRPGKDWCHRDSNGSGFAFACITPLMNGWQPFDDWQTRFPPANHPAAGRRHWRA